MLICENPRVFISYAWGTKDYQKKVLDFATSLKHDGIDVVIDRWNVKAGNDLYSFMEKSVSDPSITNVLILLDKNYAEKADGRQGGVGTETQIISPEVYGKVDQNKFIPVVLERNDAGEVCKPMYLRGRFHFDLTNEDDYAEQYEHLVRTLYGVDPYEVPDLGKRPEWVDRIVDSSPKVSTVDQEDTFYHKYANMYSVLCAYRESLRNADEEQINRRTNELHHILQELFYMSERYRYLDEVGSKKALEIVNKWNEYVPFYNEFVNASDRMSDGAQLSAQLAEQKFYNLVDLVVKELSEIK